MRPIYTLAAALSASLLAGPAMAQDSGSCEALLRDFDAHLSAHGIAENDERVAQARTQAQQSCMSGDTAAAQTSLDRAVANIGLPPVSGQAAGGDTGLTESEAPASQAGSQDQGTGQSAEGETMDGATAGQQSGTDQTSGTGGIADSQSADAQSGEQNADANQNAGATTDGQSAGAQAGEDGSEAENSDQSGASGTDTGGNEAGTQ
jgi:hypothetical protein